MALQALRKLASACLLGFAIVFFVLIFFAVDSGWGAIPGVWIMDNAALQLLRGLGFIVALAGTFFLAAFMLVFVFIFLDLALIMHGIKFDWEKMMRKQIRKNSSGF